jgi:hypothetical protein
MTAVLICCFCDPRLSEYARLPMPISTLLVVPSDSLAVRVPESLALVRERLAFLPRPIDYPQSAPHNIENIGVVAHEDSPIVVDAMRCLELFFSGRRRH